MANFKLFWRVLGLCGLLLAAANLQAAEALAARASNLLSYIAVDYPEAVKDGVVQDPQLYRQLQRYSRQAQDLLQQLPDKPGRAVLANSLLELHAGLEAKRDPAQLRRQANAAADRLAALYQMPRSPAEMLPTAEEGAALYAARCSSCHGAQGSPPASAGVSGNADLRNAQRLVNFSLYDLYNTLEPTRDDTHGAVVDSDLSSRQRWALAVKVASFTAGPGAPDAALAERYPNLVGLPGIATTRPAELPREGASALLWWRAHPQQTAQLQHPLARASGLLQLAQTAYRGGDNASAYHQLMLALREGFAPVRIQLEQADAPLAGQINQQWQDLRRAILDEAPANQVVDQFQRLGVSIARARERLQPASESTGLYGWAALLFAASLGLGLLLWYGLRRRRRKSRF